MMAELRDVKSAVRPSDTLLVVDAMTGQEAANLVRGRRRVCVGGGAGREGR